MSAPAPAPLPAAIFNPILADTYGIFLAGVFASCVLVGIVILQIFLYYTKSKSDPTVLRFLPGFLLAVEISHEVLLCVTGYKVFVYNFGNQGILTSVIPEVFIASFLQGIVVFCAHLFYTYRLWKFSRMWIIPCFTIPLTLAQLGFTFAAQSIVLTEMNLGSLQTKSFTVTVYGTHGINLFLDVFFVVAMVLLLNKERKGFAKTQTMVQRLTIMVVNTGLITTTAAFLTILFRGIQPTTFRFATFNILASVLYCNSIMANLNTRDYVRGADGAHSMSGLASVELNHMGNRTLGSTGTRDRTYVGGGISVKQDTITADDSYGPGYKSEAL